MVLSFAPRGFSLGTPVFPSPQKPTSLKSNLTRNQVGEEPSSGSASSKLLFIRLSYLPLQQPCNSSFSRLKHNINVTAEGDLSVPYATAFKRNKKNGYK